MKGCENSARDEDFARADHYLDLLERAEGTVLERRLERFDHRSHLLVAWRLCRTMPLTRAIERMSRALRRASALVGAADRYHETLTWAWMMIVDERCAGASDAEDFVAFTDRNRDLFDARGALERRYDAETLDSPLARRRFVLPCQPGGRHGA